MSRQKPTPNPPNTVRAMMKARHVRIQLLVLPLPGRHGQSESDSIEWRVGPELLCVADSKISFVSFENRQVKIQLCHTFATEGTSLIVATNMLVACYYLPVI